MSISYYINLLKEKKCWSVIAGVGTGSVVHLGFGEKKSRKKPLKNPNLSKDEKMFEPEIGLMIHCAWRLSKLDKILCGWRDSNELKSNMLKGINLLKDKKVIDIHLNQTVYDLDIYFDNNMCFQLFCDQTNNYDSDENYTLFLNQAAYTIGLKSLLETEYYQ